METWWEYFILAMVHLGALGAIGYMFDLGWRPARDSEVGRALVFKAGTLAALYFVSVVGYWWPFPGYIYFYGVALTGITGAIFYQWYSMRSARREGKLDPILEDEEGSHDKSV